MDIMAPARPRKYNDGKHQTVVLDKKVCLFIFFYTFHAINCKFMQLYIRPFKMFNFLFSFLFKIFKVIYSNRAML
jgi:hypothetical protein